MKKYKKFSLLLIPLAMGLAACSPTSDSSNSTDSSPSSSERKVIYVTDFTLEKDSFELEINGTAQINATLTPKNATKKGFNYSTTDASIATVSSEGVITGISAGTCKIEVETKGTKEDGNTVKKQISVTVKAPALTALEIATTEITVKEGATAQISCQVKPSNAVDKTVLYTSENEAIATVNATGLVTAVAEGETNIKLATVAKDKDGNALTGTVHIKVESNKIVHKVEFQNADGSLLQAIDDIEVGAVPEFTGDVPAKASDANGIYVFRGFDKEILPYATPEDPKQSIVYKAVYEAVTVTPRKATLTKQVDEKTNAEKVIFTVTGEAIGCTTETIKNRAWLDMVSTSNWQDTYSDPQAPTINADGTWSMQMEIGSNLNAGSTYISKYVWNSDTATKPIDLKLHHKAVGKRYRHTLDGKTLEDNKLPNDWDGTFPDNYVSKGYINDTTTSSYSDEADRQAYVDAIAAPTWVGLGLTFEPAEIDANGLHYSFFTNDNVFEIPAITIKNQIDDSDATATLVEKDGVVYYRIQGTAFGDAAEVEGFKIDFQNNGNIDGTNGWSYPLSTSEGKGIAKTLTNKGTITSDGKWYYDVPVSDQDALKGDIAHTYTVHFGTPYADKVSDFKKEIAEDYAPIELGDYTYSIRRDGSTWSIPSLVVTPSFNTNEITNVNKLGFEIKNENQVYMNIAGKIEGLTGAAKLVAGTRENDIALAADGTFDASVRVDDAMDINFTKSYVAASAYAIKIIDAKGHSHALNLNGLDGAKLDAISLTLNDTTAEVQDKRANFVFVNKGGLCITTVQSTWTATTTELYEKDGKAILHVSGALLAGTTIDDLMFKARVGDKDIADSFALDATMYDAATGKVDFEADITNWAAVSGAKLKMQKGNEAGDGRGINWFWCNDWTAIKKGDAIKVGNKTYSLNISGSITLTIAEEATA